MVLIVEAKFQIFTDDCITKTSSKHNSIYTLLTNSTLIFYLFNYGKEISVFKYRDIL